MPKIVLSDSAWESHGIYIRQAVMETYNGLVGIYGTLPQLTNDDFINIADFTAALAYCIEHNCPALIRSYNGVQGYVDQAKTVYPITQTFFPLGGTQNLHEEVSVFPEEEPPLIVTSGAGDIGYEDRNNTSYGNGLEFWDSDLALDNGGDQSSFSNGIILGKLLFLKDLLNCTWWEARYRARMTARRAEENRNTNMWDLHNGYGHIDVDSAINYEGLIPLDPYLFSAETFNELTDDVADLTAANGELTGQLAELEEFEFTKNVIGIAEEQDTYFGSSEAYKLRNIAVNPEGLVTLTKSLHRDRESFSKRAIKEIPETFVDRDIIDFVYHKYKQLHNIPEQDIIT